METTERLNMETNIHCLQRVLRASRPWYHREYYRYPLHQVIFDALKHARPLNWHQLVMEHPHMSVTENTKIAYTRDDNAGNQDRQVTTTIGKYLSRHFPTLKDNIIRDISALYSATGIKIVRTTAEMIYHLNRGPKSCMQNSNFDLSEHPYNVYDPQYGWAMVVREENGDTVGRALVMITDDNNKYFVRTYLKPKESTGYSHSDNVMEAWLQSNGFDKQTSWGGEKLKVIPHIHGGYVSPYLDGDVKRADLNKDYFYICGDGEYAMDDTGGRTQQEDTVSCEDCGDDFPEDDGYWVGSSEDSRVCNSCCENNYTYAYSRRGCEYYITNDDVAYVNSTPYDTNYLGDNEIIELANGDYARLEDSICIDGDWYETDDEDICYAEDTEEYALKEDCWMCVNSEKWYTNAIEYIECPNTISVYHPDHAPEHLTTSNKE